MSEVVADNCALVHAQQMGVLAVPPMPLVEGLLTTGALLLVATVDWFGETPFAERGGLGKVWSLFGDELEGIVDELNRELVA